METQPPNNYTKIYRRCPTLNETMLHIQLNQRKLELKINV